MHQIIKNNQIVNDDWQLIDVNANWQDLANLPQNSKIIVPLSVWLKYGEQLFTLVKLGNCGVWIEAGEDVSELADDLPNLPLIAFNFPQFTDGRAYSSAAILRQVYNYQSEIRAIGDVLKDQLQAMSRVGFNAFVVRKDKDINDALQGLNALDCLPII